MRSYRISLFITGLICFGITFALRMLFATLGMFTVLGDWIEIFATALNTDFQYFAIMLTVFFLLHKKLLRGSRISDEDNRQSQVQSFRKIIKILIVIAWILTGIFISFSLLKINLRDPNFPGYPDKLGLGVLWSFAVVAICIILTSIINRTLSNEKRIEKKILRSAMYGAGFIALGIWFIQLIVFEGYLHRGMKIEIIVQDLRVLFIIVVGIYVTIFFHLLEGKLLPESGEKSSKKVKELLVSELKKQTKSLNDTELLSADQISTSNDFSEEEEVTYFPQGISLKIYVTLLKRFKISSSLDDYALTDSKFNKKSNKILAGLVLGIPIIIFIIVRLVLPSNIFTGVLFLSCLCALFMVIGDNLLTFLINRINTDEKRVSKIILLQSAIYGGAVTFWIWMVPFVVIYLYVFILITDIMILNITFIAILSIVMFMLGSRIVLWYATSIKMWDAAMKNAPYVKKKASRVNLVWLIVNIPLRIFFLILASNEGNFYSNILATFWAGDSWPTVYETLLPILANELIIAIINVAVGLIVVLKVYNRKLGDSLKFVVLSQVVIYLVTLLTTIMLGLFQSLVVSYHYNFPDPRIPLIVATGIYIISIFGTLRIKLRPDTSKRIGEEFRAALKPYEEDQLKGPLAGGRETILNVQDLTTYFYTEEGVVRAVEGVSFKIYKGETLGLVGETGCGKSVTALSILRLVRPPGEIKSGSVIFEGEDLHQKTEKEFLQYRGNRITMIFQDPLNSLNPVFKVGDQISEVYLLHMENELLVEAAKRNTSIYDVARKWSQKMLKDLNIPMPRVIFDRYPHELSGGMRQRIQIAMGLACSPTLLIADEPTTALDVTIQNQILQLMKNLKTKYNTSILFITHDLGIISKMCDRVAVMYSGFIVEYGDIEKLFITPYHPYTRGLISSVPIVGKKKETLEVIPGMVPNLIYPPSGCRFHPRCKYCFEPCDSKVPKSIETEPDYFVACHLYDPEFKDLAEISIKNAEEEIIDVPTL
ncbi:MAG: ABC transporter ATP-binding protein [Promethearchaeota archaeon]